MSMSPKNNLLNSKDFPTKEEITIEPFFKEFNLSTDDFDPPKNFNFPVKDKCEAQWRGGIPY